MSTVIPSNNSLPNPTVYTKTRAKSGVPKNHINYTAKVVEYDPAKGKKEFTNLIRNFNLEFHCPHPDVNGISSIEDSDKAANYAVNAMDEYAFMAMVYSCACSNDIYSFSYFLQLVVNEEVNAGDLFCNDIEYKGSSKYERLAAIFKAMLTRFMTMIFEGALFGIEQEKLLAIQTELKNVIDIAEKYDNIKKPLTKDEIYNIIDQVALYVHDSIKLIKGFTADQQVDTPDYVAIAGANMMANMPYIGAGIDLEPGERIGFNMGNMLISAAVLSQMLPAKHFEAEVMYRKTIRLNKYYLLELIQKFYDLGGRFNIAEIQYFEKVMQIKCGSPICNLFTKNTNSFKKFHAIIDKAAIAAKAAKNKMAITNKAAIAKAAMTKVAIAQAAIVDKGAIDKAAIASKAAIDEAVISGKAAIDKAAIDEAAIDEAVISGKAAIDKATIDKAAMIDDPGRSVPMIEDAINLISIKYTIKKHLKNNDYLLLYKYLLDHVENETFRKILFNTVFKLDNYRGNLLSHLLVILNSNCADKKSVEDLLKNIVQISISHNDIVKEYYKGSYSEIHLKLMQYKVTSKYIVLADLQHMLLGILKNPELTMKQRAALHNYLSQEITYINTGQFREINKFRKSTAREMAFFTMSMEAYTIAKHSVIILFGGTPWINGPAGGAGYALMTLLPSLNEFFQLMGIFQTTTYKSAQRILKQGSYDALEKLVSSLNKQESIVNNNQSDTGPIVSDLVKDIEDKLKEKNFTEIIKLLENCENAKLKYCVLTSRVGEDFVINHLFASKIPDAQLCMLIDIWKRSVQQVDFPDLTHMSMRNFEKFVATPHPFASSSAWLLHFYKIVALINLDPNNDSKIRKINYFAGVCYRTKFDSGSVWYGLRKRGVLERWAINYGTRILTATLWGAFGSAMLTLTPATLGLSVPAAIGTKFGALAVLNALRFLFNGSLPSYFEDKDTKEYKNALAYMEQISEFKKDEENESKIFADRSLCIEMSKIDAAIHYYKTFDKETGRLLVRIDRKNKKDIPVPLDEFLKHGSFAEQFPDDQDLIDEINNNKDDLQKLKTALQKMYTFLKEGVADKYLASQAIFRFIRIIKLSQLPLKTKMEVLLQFVTIFANKGDIASRLGRDRSHVTQNNYFTKNIFAGFVMSLATDIGILDFSSFFSFLIAGSADATGNILNFNLHDPNSIKNTDSYQRLMTIFKHILMDMMKELELDIIKNNNELQEPIRKNNELQKIIKNNNKLEERIKNNNELQERIIKNNNELQERIIKNNDALEEERIKNNNELIERIIKNNNELRKRIKNNDNELIERIENNNELKKHIIKNNNELEERIKNDNELRERIIKNDNELRERIIKNNNELEGCIKNNNKLLCVTKKQLEIILQTHTGRYSIFNNYRDTASYKYYKKHSSNILPVQAVTHPADSTQQEPVGVNPEDQQTPAADVRKIHPDQPTLPTADVRDIQSDQLIPTGDVRDVHSDDPTPTGYVRKIHPDQPTLPTASLSSVNLGQPPTTPDPDDGIYSDQQTPNFGFKSDLFQKSENFIKV